MSKTSLCPIQAFTTYSVKFEAPNLAVKRQGAKWNQPFTKLANTSLTIKIESQFLYRGTHLRYWCCSRWVIRSPSFNVSAGTCRPDSDARIRLLSWFALRRDADSRRFCPRASTNCDANPVHLSRPQPSPFWVSHKNCRTLHPQFHTLMPFSVRFVSTPSPSDALSLRRRAAAVA